MDKQLKSYNVISKTIDTEQGIYEAMISTESQDRQGDTVRATGAKLDNYLKNPIVLWSHDYVAPPIAKALSIEIIPAVGLKATFQFPPVGTSQQADTIHRLWAGGFLNAASIGFNPLQAEPNAAGLDFVAWELLEFSLVGVPANADALRLAMKALEQPETKSGRVLSAANEKKIKTAVDMLTEVLSQLGEPDKSEEPSRKDVTPDVQTPTNDTGTDDASQFAPSLQHYLNALKEILK